MATPAHTTDSDNSSSTYRAVILDVDGSNLEVWKFNPSENRESFRAFPHLFQTFSTYRTLSNPFRAFSHVSRLFTLPLPYF